MSPGGTSLAELREPMDEKLPRGRRRGWRAGLPGGFIQFLIGLLWGLALPLGGLIYFVVGPGWVESDYSRGIYRLISWKVIPFTEQFGFSLSLVLTIALIVSLPLWWVVRWVQLFRRGEGFLAGLIWGPLRLLLIAPLLFVWFVSFWGTGYQRVPVAERLGLDTAKPEQAEVQQLLDSLHAVILRDLPKTPEQRDVGRAVAAISESMTAFIAESEGRTPRVPKRVKATPKGFLLFNSTSGICSPFTLEANVDGAIPDTGFVYVAAHELAHTAGINLEGEATLYGQIAGLRADDAYARYCVALDAYSDLARDLDKDARKAAMERLPQESRDELKHISEVSSSYNVRWFSKYSWKVYNSYLQSQGIKEGVRNYGESTRLFVFASRKGLISLGDAAPAPVAEEVAAPAAG